jgi:Ser/Thr protein kinase RdoA (MazF antagonist)
MPEQDTTQNQSFFRLTPERVLEAVERAGYFTTGLCYPLNSLENRVYEVEVEDRSNDSRKRLIAKFYRPGRWSKETILDEHKLLSALQEMEIPVCPPEAFPSGETLRETEDNIFFTLFPKVGGRSPDELIGDDYAQIGRLLGRIHNVSASLNLKHRPVLSPKTYGSDNVAFLVNQESMPPHSKARFVDMAQRVITLAEKRFLGKQTFVIHADCHRANLLRGRDGFFFLDFDDSAVGPAVQDFWLLLPARPKDCPQELEAMIKGYEQFRSFDHGSLKLIEALRALRYLRYASWIAARWSDPSFPRAFPHFGTEMYWQTLTNDLQEQFALLQEDEYA